MDQKTPPLNTILFVPNVLSLQGTGHLFRCLKAASEIGSPATVFLAVNEAESEGQVFSSEFLRQFLGEVKTRTSLVTEDLFDVVVLDFQKTPRAVYEAIRDHARTIVGWDEGGVLRKKIPYLIDTLPNLDRHASNVCLPELAAIRAYFSERPAAFSEKSPEKVLVCFGGADPRGLTRRMLAFLKKNHWVGANSGRDVTVVKGPLAQFELVDEPGIRVSNAPKNLAELLDGFDLVIASWGLLVLESLARGTAVLLFNPTSYHEKLTKNEGLPSLGTSIPSWKKFLEKLSQAPRRSRLRAEKLPKVSRKSSDYFSTFHGGAGACPVCKRKENRVIARTDNKTYFACDRCSMEYMEPFNLAPKVYSETYFFEEYQKQYGKTYLDDFQHIQKMGRARLDFLERQTNSIAGKVVLDIGCAYGPFLAAVRELGGDPYGLDIAESAVEYVNKTLGMKASACSFLEFDWEKTFPQTARPQVVTMWYVIEHFPDLERILTKVSSLVHGGGIFAFSTPNGKGISRLFDPLRFWRESPDDHFSIWNRQIAKKVLSRFGFRVVAFRMTGSHPERFPGLKKRSGFLFSLVSLLDKMFGWGDTFEVYAKKIGETA